MCWSRGAGHRQRYAPLPSPVGGGIAVPPTRKILDHPATPLHRICVAWPHWNFTVAAGEIEDITRLAKAGDTAAQGAHQRLPLPQIRPEMTGAAREIGMVEVIGLDPRGYQASEQAFEHRRVVVHALEEHGLAQERNAGLRELAAGRTECRRELSRMVRVDRDVERL